ncbi:hypothetical protein KDH_41490 [Dictyobacter sp. S3.2.2.5]|uniref:PLL-like beta propeller domain-containing protein n=1 Tax=Dictyobacter halimunensis TaxID=3026934 RepID=A0ABQ6FUJ3_9CHLR|nr:hypothetical protein KDH_41490 [Dictyobacter sp. S3.2.2.5]
MVQSLAFNEVATAISGLVVENDQTQHVVIATGDANIYYITPQANEQLAFSVIGRLDGEVINALAVYASADGALHSVAATVDGNLYHFEGEQKQFVHHFEDVMVTALAAYSSADNTYHVLAATSDDVVYHLNMQSEREATPEPVASLESNATSIAGYFTSKTATHHLLVAASDGHLYDYAFGNQQTAQRRSLGFFDERFFGMAAYQLPIDGSRHLIVATRDGKLYHVSYLNEEASFQTDVLARFYLVSEGSMTFLTAYAQADGLQHVVVASSDGSLHHFSFRGSPSQQHKLTSDALALQQKDVDHSILTTFMALY